MDQRYIRNFSIIAHIDHGKSTLADRLLEFTKTLPPRKMREQVLDNMDLERERGITIKAHAIRMSYKSEDGNEYILNLIDTPGHVDFTYEVSRSLAACEGALLVVDASQGVEAQTISNLFLALDNNLPLIPIINKIDLPGAQIDLVKGQLKELLGIEENQIILASAKQGIGIEEILEAIIKRIPAPSGEDKNPLKGLIFDSFFDQYRGAIPYIRIKNGCVRKGDKIKFFSNQKEYEVDEVGYLRLKLIPAEKLSAGEVGYLIANIKNVTNAKVGDTITLVENPASSPLPGFKDIKPLVFSGFYPADSENYEKLKEALEKLRMNDASLVFEPESSNALGFGFRCGFLGLLHLEIVQERLRREYGQPIIATVPNVEYRVALTSGEKIYIDNPALLPPSAKIEKMEEPYVLVQIISPSEYIGNIMKLVMERRGVYKTTEYVDKIRVSLHFELPLSEMIFDFYDKLKSITRGYASLDYELADFKESDLVKLNLLINGEGVDALSSIVHKDKAYFWGRSLTQKLRKLIPRQLFEVAIQAAIGSKVIARETVKPLRKDVTARLYGGDVTRKRKLLEKQKEGKKRMKRVGSVEIPQEAFLAILQVER